MKVTDRNGVFLAYAHFSKVSAISLRILSQKEDDCIDRQWWKHKIERAVELRTHLAIQSNAKRLIFGEADALPGLVVDQFGDYLTVQILTAGMERLKSDIIDILSNILHPRGRFYAYTTRVKGNRLADKSHNRTFGTRIARRVL